MNGWDPLDASSLDGDNLPDDWEVYRNGDTSLTDDGDPDGDYVSNLEEFLQGTDPTVSPDTDGDTYEDDLELSLIHI